MNEATDQSDMTLEEAKRVMDKLCEIGTCVKNFLATLPLEILAEALHMKAIAHCGDSNCSVLIDEDGIKIGKLSDEKRKILRDMQKKMH